MWTSHGYQIIGTIALDPVSNDRPRVGRCGGPKGGCKMCEIEARQAQKDAGRDEFGNKLTGGDESTPPPLDSAEKEAVKDLPVLDGSEPIARILGRARLALLAVRPIEEADAVSDRLASTIAEHNVLMAHHGVDPETLKKLPSEEETESNLHGTLEAVLDKDRADALVAALMHDFVIRSKLPTGA